MAAGHPPRPPKPSHGFKSVDQNPRRQPAEQNERRSRSPAVRNPGRERADSLRRQLALAHTGGSRHSGAIRETGSGGLDPAVIHAAHVPREAMPPASAGLQIQHSDLGVRMLVFEVFRGLDRDGLIIAVRLAVNGSPAGVIRLDHCL